MAIKNQLTADVQGMLDDAVHAELFAAHLYRHVSNQLQRLGYLGAARFFRGEAADEVEHYQRHADYMNDRGAVARVPALAAADDAVASLGDALTLAYSTELALQRDYARWYGLASSDPITQQHLLQYLEIQRRSVGEYGDLLARLERAAGDPCGIIIIDQEMGNPK